MNTDWTSIFRQNHGVDEYILIGECDDGQCGDNYLTWGNPHNFDDDDDNIDVTVTTPLESNTTVVSNEANESTFDVPPRKEPPTPQYILDGYVRYDLNEFAPHQFSRFDCRTSKTGRTVSFRKNKR